MHNKHSHICPWWLAYTFDNPIRSLTQSPQKIIAPYLKEGMTFIDFGCGMGYYSVNGAKIVGSSGNVIAVDVQEKMLETVRKRAKKADVEEIIKTHLCKQDDIDLKEEADFALAMWMVHETPDISEFFKQVKKCLKPGGLLFVIEPTLFHVSQNFIENEIKLAQEAGYEFCGYKDSGLFSKGFLLKSL